MLESKYEGTIGLTHIQCTTPGSGFEPSLFIPSSHTDSPSFPGDNKQQQQLCKNKRPLYQLCDPQKKMSQSNGDICKGEESLLRQLKPKFMSLLLRIQRNVRSFIFITSLGPTKVFHSVPQRYWDLGGRFMLDTRLQVDHLLCTAGNKWSVQRCRAVPKTNS